MTFRSVIYFTFLCLFLQCCHYPSEEEVKKIEELNKLYSTYYFYAGKDISGTYLNVKIESAKVDTVRLNKIYEEAIGLKVDDKINWVYLNVFDTNGDYLFTIVKQGTSYKYFKEANIS